MVCFSYSQVGENEPFVSELLSGLATTIADLEPHQYHTFYESVCILHVPPNSTEFILALKPFLFCFVFQVAHMIQAESDPQKRDEYLQRLMELPNQVFFFFFWNWNWLVP